MGLQTIKSVIATVQMTLNRILGDVGMPLGIYHKSLRGALRSAQNPKRLMFTDGETPCVRTPISQKFKCLLLFNDESYWKFLRQSTHLPLCHNGKNYPVNS